MPTQRNVFMVYVKPTGGVIVQDLLTFRSRGGFTEEWGKAWQPIVARGKAAAETLAEATLKPITARSARRGIHTQPLPIHLSTKVIPDGR